MSIDHDDIPDYLTKGEIFLASIGRKPEDEDFYQEEIFDDSASDEEDEDGWEGGELRDCC